MGGGRLGVGGQAPGDGHHNEHDLHVAPGGHHAHHQEQHEDLRGGEGVVDHIRDETKNQENLDTHEDYQPGKDKHPLSIGDCGLGHAAIVFLITRIWFRRIEFTCCKSESLKKGREGCNCEDIAGW